MNTSLNDLMNSATMMDANTALEQIGSEYLTAGLRLYDMTARTLTFTVRFPGNGASRVMVTLAGDDTYTVSAIQWLTGKDGFMDWRVVAQSEGIYCEQLGESLVSITKEVEASK